MENLELFKNAILCRNDINLLLEVCYKDLLDDYSTVSANTFVNLLEMVEENNDRINEIFKVIDFIRFPVSKAV